MRLAPELERAWSRVEAGGDPAIVFADVALAPAEQSEIDTRCQILADKLRAEAAAAEREAEALHSLCVSRKIEGVEANVTYLRRTKQST